MAGESVTITLGTRGARAVRRAFERVENSIGDVGDRARRTARRIGRGLRAIGTAAAVGVGAATTAMAAFGKSVLDASSTMEQARIKFDAIFGSMEEGAAAVENLRSLAARVPATFEEIVETGQTIASAVSGPAELQKRMRQLIQLTAVFPINLQEAASNWVRFWRAGAGAADLFREKGINAALGVQAGMRTTVEESRELWTDFFQNNTTRLEGALSRLADSYQGIMSMIRDQWLQFRVAVGKAGLFDAAKEALDDFRQAFEDWVDEGGAERFARVFARSVATMVGAIQGLVNAVMEAQAFFRDTFFGRIFGVERTSRGKLAAASERLQELKSMRDALEAGRPGAAGRAANALGVTPKTPESLLIALDTEIAKLERRIDRPGGLVDQFSDASSLLEDFNTFMDEFQRRMEGAATATQSANRAMGGSGGGGGGGGLSLSNATIAGAGGVTMPLAAQTQGLPADDKVKNAQIAWQNLADSLGVGVAELRNASQVAISSFGAMAEAAIRGSQQMEVSIINGLSNILRSLPGVGPVAGSIIGAVGGIASAIVGGGSSKPQPVEVKNKDPIAVEEQNPQGPEDVVLQFIDSADPAKLQNDLKRRTRRDATERIPFGTDIRSGGS